MFSNLLKKENILLRDALQDKIIFLNRIIKPGFNFGTVSKKNNPKEYFVAVALNKIYSVNVSIENVLLANDVFLSVYLYRYAYELYIKILYIFSGLSDQEILFRLNNFFENKDLKIKEYLKKINNDFVSMPPNFKNNHFKKYRKMSQIIHPNIDSINIHLHTTPDEQFEFLVSAIKLTLWHIIEIILLFLKIKALDLDKNINQKQLILLQNQILHNQKQKLL